MTRDFSFLSTLIRKDSTSFYRAFRKLPKEKAEAVFSVYAICRLLDDAANSANTQKTLEIRKELFEQVRKGILPMNPLWNAFAFHYRKYHLRPEPFRMMFEGQSYDLTVNPFTTIMELNHYCDLRAGSIALMLMPILSPAWGESVKIYAFNLGRGMEYTSLLRDVGNDLKLWRSCIPLELTQGRTRQEVCQTMAVEALKLYQTALEEINLFFPDSRLSVILAIFHCRGILEKLQRLGFPKQQGRVSLSFFETLQVYLRARLFAIRRKVYA